MPPSRLMAVLRQPLTRYQAIIGISAGLLTISMTLASLTGLRAATPPPPVHGELVATVQDARSRRPIAGATVEILTPTDAIVTTLGAARDGRARYQLREGEYRLRVTHPRFLPDVKHVLVQAGQRANVMIRLATRTPPSPPKPVSKPVEKPSAFRKFLKSLGL